MNRDPSELRDRLGDLVRVGVSDVGGGLVWSGPCCAVGVMLPQSLSQEAPPCRVTVMASTIPAKGPAASHTQEEEEEAKEKEVEEEREEDDDEEELDNGEQGGRGLLTAPWAAWPALVPGSEQVPPLGPGFLL